MERWLLISHLFALMLAMPSEMLACDPWEFRRSLNKTSYGYQTETDVKGQVVETFALKPGDCTKAQEWDDCSTHRERSEVIEIGSGTLPDQKESWWYSWYFLYPRKNQVIWPIKVAIGQFHQAQGGPLWMMQVGEKSLFWEHIPSGQKFELGEIEALFDQWVRVEIEVLWRPDQKGFLRLWLNGDQKVNYRGPTSQGSPIFFKYGIYRSFLNRLEKGQKIPDYQSVKFSNICKANKRSKLSNSAKTEVK